jgi:hypothetical protein
MLYKDFILEAGGNASGKIEVHRTSVEQAYLYAQQIFAREGKDLDEEIPTFRQNYQIVQAMAKGGHTKRKDMPVISNKDIGKLRDYLEEHGIKTGYETVNVGELRPIQEQIYFDQVIEKKAKSSLRKSKSFVGRNIFVVDKNYNIIDGHHRYLSAMLISPTVKVSVMKANTDLKTLLKHSLTYSDEIVKNVRNK